MRAFLTVQSGPAQGKMVTAEQGALFRIGRQANADLPITDDRALSGLHFAILCDKLRCRIRDLNSTNGTFVNGIRVNLVELYDRDTIRAGNSDFQVRFEGQINTTVIDPLLYPEVAQLRNKKKPQLPDKAKAGSPPAAPFATAPFAVAAGPPLDVSLEATEALPPEVADLVRSIVADGSGAADAAVSAASEPPPERPSTTRILRLNVSFHDASGDRHIWLSPGQTIIVGRNEMADVSVVGDAAISGVHFALDCEEKRCRIRDLQSQNGTRLNDVTIPYATIYTGDHFTAGKTEFQVTIEGGKEAPDAPLRTWVFEDLVRRKFATFVATPVGDEHHLVDAVGTEPRPIELLRRLARHRDIGVLVNRQIIDAAAWQEAADETFTRPDARSQAADSGPVTTIFHIPDVEKVVSEIDANWGEDAMAFIFPHEGQEAQLKTLTELLAEIRLTDDAPATPRGWVDWLVARPEQVPLLLANVEALLIAHPDPAKWRILCETDFITRLNRLGYLPAAAPSMEGPFPDAPPLAGPHFGA